MTSQYLVPGLRYSIIGWVIEWDSELHTRARTHTRKLCITPNVFNLSLIPLCHILKFWSDIQEYTSHDFWQTKKKYWLSIMLLLIWACGRNWLENVWLFCKSFERQKWHGFIFMFKFVYTNQQKYEVMLNLHNLFCPYSSCFFNLRISF